MASLPAGRPAEGANPTTIFDDVPISARQMTIFVLCFVLNMIDGMDVVIMSYTASAVMAEYAIDRVTMGGVFSAGFLGMAAGGLTLGAFADRIGRRRLILWGLALIAVAVIAGGYSRSVAELLATRVVAGFGIGGLLASVTALTAEYAPARIRNTIVMAVTAGYPLGALLTGLIASWTVPEFGWRATMIGAGVLTAIVLVPCILFLSESLAFLARRHGGTDPAHFNPAAFNRVLHSMGRAPVSRIDPAFFEAHGTFRITDLLRGKYRSLSLRLWAGLFACFMVMYYLLSWIPRIAAESGLAAGDAIVAGALYSGGGFLGVISVGMLADRIGYVRSIAGYCAFAFLSMLVYATYRGDLVIVLLIATIMGFTVQGAVGAFYGTAAKAYPVEMKSTGVGWMIGIGRIGAILGPVVGGILLDANLPLLASFAFFGVLMLLAAAVLWPVR